MRGFDIEKFEGFASTAAYYTLILLFRVFKTIEEKRSLMLEGYSNFVKDWNKNSNLVKFKIHFWGIKRFGKRIGSYNTCKGILGTGKHFFSGKPQKLFVSF